MPAECRSHDAASTHAPSDSPGAACAARRVSSGETFCRAGSLKGGFISTRSNEPGPSPADSLETKEKGQLLEGMLDTLNPDQRAAFVLFEVEGYSGEEIARLQEVPLNTVWARIHKARKKLQARIAKLEKRELGRS